MTKIPTKHEAKALPNENQQHDDVLKAFIVAHDTVRFFTRYVA